MKKLANLTRILLLVCLIGTTNLVMSQDVILQGFYWNTHPGDLSENETGGIWWDSLASIAPKIGAAGFSTIWAPPPQKGFAGKFDMGYGPYDYYDMGEFDSKGTVRTRHGSASQLRAMIQAYHDNGINVMADVVLNHRGGGDVLVPREVGGGSGYLEFNPPSGRLPGDAGDFHPNNFHPDQDGPYHNPLFFEDICYFNNPTTTPPTDADGNPSTWYFGAPGYMGEMGVDLISWGRYLMDDLGFDELRLDAIKHIEPDYLGKFIIEVQNGDQPFALGEFFDFNTNDLVSYHSAVTNSSNQGGIKGASMSLFDFPLRGSLEAVLNDPSGNQDLYNTLGGSGLVWGSSLSGFDVVTWLDTHDTDRTGFVEDSNGCAIPFGNSCLRFETLDDHHPIFSDKEDMGYPFLLAAEGRPIVFWKDYFWFGLDKDIDWLIALRKELATGTSDHIQNLNGFWPQDGAFDFENNGGNMFAMTRNGLTSGESDGLVLGLNDHPSKTNAVFVNTPFTNKHLKDYSDGFMFETSEAFGDGRALVKAQPRDYSWYAPTGLYPLGAGISPSHFTMEATPGGCTHFVALTASNSENYVFNGGSIEVGDEVAAVNSNGDVVGIGRIGQGFQWDGVHDMVIELLGAPSSNGMANNEEISIVIYDASTSQEITIGTLTYASAGSTFNFSPDRPNSPNRNGNFSTFAVSTTSENTFNCSGISLINGFGIESCSITDVSLGAQTACNINSNTIDQELIISFENAPEAGTLVVNGASFPLETSPQTVSITTEANGLPYDAEVSISGTDCSLSIPSLFVAPQPCNEICNNSSQADSAYDDAWSSGDNDGSGFGPWSLSTNFNNPGNGGHFVFTSTANGDGDNNGDGDIDDAGRALGMYANSGDVSNAVRPFSTPLQEGSELTVNIDNGWIENGGAVGLGIQNAAGDNLLEFFFAAGNPEYFISDSNGANASGIGFTDEGIQLTFTLGENAQYDASVTTLGNGVSYSLSGTLLSNSDQSPAQIRFFNSNAGFDAPRNLYIGAMEICQPVIPTCDATLIDSGITCPGSDQGFFTINMTDGLSPFNVELNGQPIGSFDTNEFTVPDLTSGSYLVDIIDANDCQSTLEITIEEFDDEAPVISCPANISVENDDNACGAVVNFEATATDNCSASITYSHAPGSEFPVGVTEVTVTATDLSGNTSECSFTIEVTDTESPVIACPMDIVIPANENCLAVATWEELVSSDNCGITNISSNYESGDEFGLGSTEVTYEVTDEAGNLSSCSFTITVVDETAPTINADLIPTYFYGPYGIHEVVSEVTDNCDGTNVISTIETPQLTNPEVRLYRSYWVSVIKFNPNRNRIKVIAPDPEALFNKITENGIEVSNGQYLIQKTGSRSNKSYYFFDRAGELYATSSSDGLDMISIATDQAGNTSVVTTTPESSLRANSSGRVDNGSIDFEEPLNELKNAEEQLNEFQVFPNPAKDYLNISNIEELGENAVLQLYDQTGKMVLQQNLIDQDINVIEIGNLRLSKGLYVLNIIGSIQSRNQRIYIE